MTGIGIIGGSGLTRLQRLAVDRREVVTTPYGNPSAPMLFGKLDQVDVVFLPRHGGDHQVPPHKVNYRANIWALREVGVSDIVGMTAVGGISQDMQPGVLCVPDQIIDYTYGRHHTYFEGNESGVRHVDFSEPYCQALRDRLVSAGERAGLSLLTKGTYGATQGPRLETAAEIQRLARDGCDLVGMTGMPEAGLARELGLCYANLSLVVNWAAGLSPGPISMEEIETQLSSGVGRAIEVLVRLNND